MAVSTLPSLAVRMSRRVSCAMLGKRDTRRASLRSVDSSSVVLVGAGGGGGGDGLSRRRFLDMNASMGCWYSNPLLAGGLKREWR